MRLRRIRLENFRRYRSLELEFPDGVFALVGANGAGKSTLLEAVLYALFGNRALRTVKDQVRHTGAAPSDDVVVHLDLEAGGQALSVRRTLRGRSQAPDAVLCVDEAVLVQSGAGSGDAATREVERILGLDLEGFRATVVAQQKDLSRLVDLPPAKRKQQVLSMLGIDRLDRAIHEARAKRRDLLAQVEGMRSMLADRDALQERLALARTAREEHLKANDEAVARATQTQERVQTAEARVGVCRDQQRRHDLAAKEVAEVTRRAETAAVRLQHAEQRVSEAALAAQQAERLEPTAAKAADAEAALARARQAHEALRRRQDESARLEALRKRLAIAKDAIQDVPDPRPEVVQRRERAAALQAEVASVQQRRRRLSALGHDAPCPTCERPLNGHLAPTLEALHMELERLEQEHEKARQAVSEGLVLEQTWSKTQEQRGVVQRLEHQVQDLEERLPAAPEAVPDLDPLEAAWSEAREAQVAWRSAQDRAKDLPRLRQERDMLLKTHTQLQAEQAAAAEALQKAPAAEGLEEAEADWRTLLGEERATSAALVQAEQALAKAVQEATGMERALAEDAERRQKVQTAEDALRHWTALAGTRGGGLLDQFRDHLTDRIGPALSQEAGRLLAHFTDGRYDEVLLDQDYEVYIGDGGTQYSLDRFSGGEADVVHLALRLAVGRLLAERSRAEIRFLALDEVFGSLDAQRRGHVLAALERLGGLYSQVLVVTHLGELRDALDHTLEAVADGADTHLVMHNG